MEGGGGVLSPWRPDQLAFRLSRPGIPLNGSGPEQQFYMQDMFLAFDETVTALFTIFTKLLGIGSV